MFILHLWSEQNKHSEVKSIKKGIKNFHPSINGWEGVCLCLLNYVIYYNYLLSRNNTMVIKDTSSYRFCNLG
jgi:hypothetical protein